MSKKQKIPLTSEEKAASRLRRSDGRIRFLAVLIAAALAVGILAAASRPGPEIESAVPVAGLAGPGQDAAPTPPAPPAPPAGGRTEGGLQVTSAKEAADLINSLTAQAAEGRAGFKYSKLTEYTGEGMKLDSALIQKSLDAVLGRLNPPTDAQTVVGDFIGIGEKKGIFSKGSATGRDENGNDLMADIETFKATRLVEQDISSFTVDGDRLVVTLPDCRDPLRDNSTALARLTDDFGNNGDVKRGLSEQKDLPAELDESEAYIAYSGLRVTATVSDGKPVALIYEFDAEARMSIRIVGLFNVRGRGTAHRVLTYSDFKF